MNQCEQAQLLSAAHDNELSDEQTRLLEQHVAQCSACADALERMRAISRRFDMCPRMEMPQELREQVLAVPSHEQERSVLRLVNRLTAMAAGLAVAGTVWVMTTTPSQRGGPPANWEQAAMLVTDVEADDTSLAEWVIADLRWERN
jgi:anti-sigma factor RsiW